MKRIFVSVLSLIISASVFSNDSFQVESVTQSNLKWQFQRIQVFQAELGVHINGRLNAQSLVGLPRGHVDMAAYTQSGELLATANSDSSVSLLTNKLKQKGGVHFSLYLTQAIPATSIIKLAFHEGDYLPSQSAHDGNIAHF